jgi:hypothetical protein
MYESIVNLMIGLILQQRRGWGDKKSGMCRIFFSKLGKVPVTLKTRKWNKDGTTGVTNTGMANRRFPVSWIYLLLFGYASFCLIAGIFLAEGTLHPARRSLPPEAIAEASQMAQRYGTHLDEVAITAGDGIILRAWNAHLPDREQGMGDVVILLHGVSDNRFGMSGYAEILLNRGYSVLMPDAGLMEKAVETWRLTDCWNGMIFGTGSSG